MDTFGHEFLNLMKQEGSSSDGILVTDEKPTGVGFIVKDVKQITLSWLPWAPTSSFQKKSSKSILTRFRQQMCSGPAGNSGRYRAVCVKAGERTGKDNHSESGTGRKADGTGFKLCGYHYTE